MTGGEHRNLLTDALLRDWANLSNTEFESCFKRWLESNGGCLVQTGRAVSVVAEEMERGFTTGSSVYNQLKVDDEGYPVESYVWDELLPKAKTIPPPIVPLGTTWALVMHSTREAIIEGIVFIGPRGGRQKGNRIGWHFIGRPDMEAKFKIKTTRPGIGGFELLGGGEYEWLWGNDHVAMIPSSLQSIRKVLATVPLFSSILASMLNEMLDKITPANPDTVQAACAAPNVPRVEVEDEDTTFVPQQVRTQREMVTRCEAAKEQALADFRYAEAELKRYTEKLARQEKLQPADLNEALATMLEKGLVSEIRKDKRGLWFLFDDVHAIVSPELLAVNTRKSEGIEAGVYKVNPAVVHLPWDKKGSRWVCGSPDGEGHAHHHVSVNGPWGPPCMGDRDGGQGPKGMSNSQWFDLLWDTDPVKWAEFIHQFLGRTNYESGHNYRPIWECATLVKPLHPKAILKVKKIIPPTLLVNRTKPGTEPLPVPKDNDPIPDNYDDMLYVLDDEEEVG